MDRLIRPLSSVAEPCPSPVSLPRSLGKMREPQKNTYDSATCATQPAQTTRGRRTKSGFQIPRHGLPAAAVGPIRGQERKQIGTMSSDAMPPIGRSGIRWHIAVVAMGSMGSLWWPGRGQDPACGGSIPADGLARGGQAAGARRRRPRADTVLQPCGKPFSPRGVPRRRSRRCRLQAAPSRRHRCPDACRLRFRPLRHRPRSDRRWRG